MPNSPSADHITPRGIHALWRWLSTSPTARGKKLIEDLHACFPHANARELESLIALGKSLDLLKVDIDVISLTPSGRKFASLSHWRFWNPSLSQLQRLHRPDLTDLFIPGAEPSNRPIVIDLFAGAGGLSLGFESAGFNVAVATDNDPQACAAHRQNFPHTQVIEGDIRSISENPRFELCERFGIDPDSVAGIVGGPPCQGFSYIGERVSGDERNLLTTNFVDIVLAIEPTFFLMENVAGLKSSGIEPDFHTYIQRLAKPIGEPATRIVDALPRASLALAKRDRQYRKRLVSRVVLSAKSKARTMALSGSDLEDMAYTINDIFLLLKSELNDAISETYSGPDRAAAIFSLEKLNDAFADLSFSLVTEILLERKSLDPKLCEQWLKSIASNPGLNSTIGSRILNVCNQYDSAPKGATRNGTSVGPILLHIMDRLSDRYDITGPAVLSSASFGAPQDRRRLFLAGVHRSVGRPFSFPKPTHKITENLTLSDMLFSPTPTAHQALSDLPDADQFSELIDGDIIPARAMFQAEHEYSRLMRLEDFSKADLSLPRPDWDPFVLDACKRTLHADHALTRIRATTPGAQDSKSHRKRLSPDRPSHTLRAGTREGKGSHTAVRPLHYEHDRVITVREGARLMGYPDWMKFHPTKWHGMRLVGNGVPYHIGNALAQNFKAVLDAAESSDEEVIVSV